MLGPRGKSCSGFQQHNGFFRQGLGELAVFRGVVGAGSNGGEHLRARVELA